MIRSDRNVYIGGHVTRPVREEVDRLVAQAKCPSISKFIADAVEEKLARLRQDESQAAA